MYVKGKKREKRKEVEGEMEARVAESLPHRG